MATTSLISSPGGLHPQTAWNETIWSSVPEEALVDRTTRSRLCPAVLLPFRNGKPDWDSFVRELEWIFAAGTKFQVEVVPVLNADTGYIFQLSEREYAEVLKRFRDAFPRAPFIAGVTARGRSPGATPDSVAKSYEILLRLAQSHERMEVMLMTSPGLEALPVEKRRDAYFLLADHLRDPGIVHALEPAFVPWATPFGPWLLHQLATHPKFHAGKISTLDEPHFLYWTAMCRGLGLPFSPHSGDDFGLATAIRMGMPLLIGAAASAAPLVCAAKAMWLMDASSLPDTRVYKLFEALQSLCDEVFRFDQRFSAAAYKHSTAHVLAELGVIASAECHPLCTDLRPADEKQRMQEALRRPTRIAKSLGIDLRGPGGRPAP